MFLCVIERRRCVVKKKTIDAMPRRTQDRRLLANVPDKANGRIRPDRRGHRQAVKEALYSPEYIEKVSSMSFRYFTSYAVRVTCMGEDGKVAVLRGRSRDISATGIRVEFQEDDRSKIALAKSFQLRFQITPGTLPEGYVARVRTEASLVRVIPPGKTHGLQCAFQFAAPLARYNARRKDRTAGWASAVFLFLLTLLAASLCTGTLRGLYAWPLYAYCALSAFYCLLAYLFASRYQPVLIDKAFTPGVSIILPCRNEAQWIADAILSCVNQEYPIEKLEIIIIDDASTDSSAEKISEVLQRIHTEGARFNTRERVRYFHSKTPKGRGGSLVAGMARAKHELVLFTDARGLLEPFTVRNIVQPFSDSRVAGVTGRVEVANTYTNGVTRMQSVRRSLEDRVLRSAQSCFDAAASLSRTMGCCRKDLLLGKISGPDCADGRRLARVLLRRHQVVYQDTARCTWVAPNTLRDYALAEQDEKRSLVLGLSSVPRMWKKEPAMGVLYTLGALLFVCIIPAVAYSGFLMAMGVFPWALPLLLAGAFWTLAALQGLMRKSWVWFTGMARFVFYEILLFWQYPAAWLTWWVRRRGDGV